MKRMIDYNFFASTSCRYDQIVPDEHLRNKHHKWIQHTHNTKEFIQYYNFFTENLHIPDRVKHKVFRRWYIGDKTPINIKKIQQEYDSADFVIVEICSRKIYKVENFYAHHLAVDGGDTKFNSEKEGKIEQSDEQIYNDLETIKTLVHNKKLIISSHINPLQFPKRKKLINTLQSHCEKLDINFFRPSDFITPSDTEDVNHLNKNGHIKMKKELFKYISQLR